MTLIELKTAHEMACERYHESILLGHSEAMVSERAAQMNEATVAYYKALNSLSDAA